MSSTGSTTTFDSSIRASRRGRLALYGELTKFRLSALVLVTAVVGYLLGMPIGVNWLDAGGLVISSLLAGDFDTAADSIAFALRAVDWIELLLVLAGTGLAAGGTSAINQWYEWDRDRAMMRTQNRPVPSRAISRNEAFIAGLVMIAVGAGMIFQWVNPLAGFLTLLTATIYIVVYTPMKPKSTLNTLVGAVCGGIPPMIGWAAAADTIELGALVLAGILFVWQLPHFLALAWLHRDDYERGGFRMLPIIDRTGEITGRISILMSLLLVPLALMMVLALRAARSDADGGLVFALVAIVLGLFFAWTAWRLYETRTRTRARALFLVSIIYLPLLLGALVIDQPRPPLKAMMFDASANAQTTQAERALADATP